MSRLYTKDHEWIELNGDVATIGITDYAQKQLGDVVYVELPENGRNVQAGDDAAVVESVKAASEVYAPIDGTVTETNTNLEGNPGLVNLEPEKDGWFFRIVPSDKAQLQNLMDDSAYRDYINGL